MKVELFDFSLPDELIAQHAIEPRDAARLLHVSDRLTDGIVSDLPALLNSADVLVFNNSKVIPARLFTEVNGKSVEILLHKRVAVPCHSECSEESHSHHSEIPRVAQDDYREIWQCFARPARKLKVGMHINFAADFSAKIVTKLEDGQVVLRFDCARAELFDKLRAHGHMPLPPYIARTDTQEDAARYQTLYAKNDGSVAAPTAGLHFTEELLAALKACGVKFAYVTLHVGAGTFQPVKVEDTDLHQMHSEWIEITQDNANIINQAKSNGGKVVAVGTTSLRVLESVAGDDGRIEAFSGETDIFITPGYQFKLVDKLMTNFHLPRSTLFMLVSAFAGTKRMHDAYQHAIKQAYRFYSYGDASLLERDNIVDNKP